MAGADYELQTAIDAALKADATVAGLVSGRIYDRVPLKAPSPYIQIGQSDTTLDRMSCVRSWTVYPTIHVWSEQVGYGEAKQIVGAIADCLDGAALALETLRLVLIVEHRSEVFRDADGLTSHGIVVFKAIVEKRS